ncbi:hypothetical protein Golob_024008, partial [Gossypium lobatum]|nr:hypothetical protein [Gossypium lobatum]
CPRFLRILNPIKKNQSPVEKLFLFFETELVQNLQEETVDDFAESGHDPLIASLYQMDLDRAQFLLRSYLRVRLQKIEKFMFHIWKMDTYKNRLSIEEEKFTERCIRDIGKHLEETVLSKLPDNYQSVLKQSIISEEDDMGFICALESMVSGAWNDKNRKSLVMPVKHVIPTLNFSLIPEPQLDTFVVAKCERATRPLYLDGSRQSASFDSRQFAILTWMTTFKWCLEIYAFCVTGPFKRN